MYYFVDISKISVLDIKNNIIKEVDNILNIYYDHFTGIYIKSKKFLNALKQNVE